MPIKELHLFKLAQCYKGVIFLSHLDRIRSSLSLDVQLTRTVRIKYSLHVSNKFSLSIPGSSFGVWFLFQLFLPCQAIVSSSLLIKKGWVLGEVDEGWIQCILGLLFQSIEYIIFNFYTFELKILSSRYIPGAEHPKKENKQTLDNEFCSTLDNLSFLSLVWTKSFN